MAHVLLPCELPFWPEVQAQISALRRSRDVAQVVGVFRAIYRICSAAVEQVDEDRASEDEMRFDLCEALLEDFEDTSQLLDVIFPTVVDFARRIEDCRPQHFIYSLQAEEGSWNLSREFVASLLAHSLLSTFPLRTLRSHPTLQDFNRCSIYRYLTSDQHQRSLTNLLRYFKEVRSQIDGYIRVNRRILRRCPPLTEWVCGTAPLCPLTVRHVASINDAEQHLYRVLPVNANLAVLKHVKCAENEFLLEHPELSVLQLFCESLKENEVLVVEGLRPLRVQSKLKQASSVASKPASGKRGSGSVAHKSATQRIFPLLPAEEYRLNSCEEMGRLGLLDGMSFDREFLYRQYLDETLLFNLNKCLNAFQQARESITETSNRSPSTSGQTIIGDTSNQADASKRCSRCIFTLGSTSPSDRQPSPVSCCHTSSSSCCSDDDSNDVDDDQGNRRQHSTEALLCGGGAPCVSGGNETGIVVARHLLTDNLLQTHALLNSPKHPSPRPHKRTVCASTSIGADNSEATLLNQSVGQPLMLPRPAQGQPLGTLLTPAISAALTEKRPPGVALVSRAQMVLSAPPVSSPRRIPRTLSKRYSRQLSAEDDYFTAEESLDENEEDRDFTGLSPRSLGMSVTSSQMKSLHKRRWRTARSRSTRTFDSELEGQLSMQSSLDYTREPSGSGKHLRREV
ncbi:hypothetical protein BIW11_05433 [Tropilaelaps mercedesae]|uniref:PARG helical domain-containing protein n=1 Tax=Tropilaelaps mercedesae TaxID=418985 RepID=A0A1V9Y2A9_9ACAR|nr:hypothetical protein BIW11_05433 [Tropilaelaps mercedesae]